MPSGEKRLNKNTGVEETQCGCGRWEASFGINPWRNTPYKTCPACRSGQKKLYASNTTYRKKRLAGSVKQYRERRTDPVALKRRRFLGWEKQGIDLACFEEIYTIFCNTKNCDDCKCEFGQHGDGTMTFKCLDHDHETGQPRAILCGRCNLKRG